MIASRDYNQELLDNSERNYWYNFDFDVMHHYMLKSFKPFFKGNDVLELGSFEGAFTQRLESVFSDVTCIEASSNAMQVARKKVRKSTEIHNALFENVTLHKKYTNIIMTHVLEHVDDPVAVLRRVNDEWLMPNGYFFLVCPNANAASRQIAVKMGIIPHNTAVTPGEAAHGHKATYTFDSLEKEVRAAGLSVVYRTGIFFKALANFQWDRLLATDIISREFLDGCFAIGQLYPDLCASIFLLCRKDS